MILRHFLLAWKGRKVWLTYKKKFRIDNEFILFLMPDDNLELNNTALECISDYMSFRQITKALVLTVTDLPANLKVLDEHQLELQKISPTEMSLLIKFCIFGQFVKNIRVISLKEPFGSAGLLNIPNITLSYFVKVYFFEGIGISDADKKT